MFGYLRPEKDTLLVREFAIYRAVYCGICKQIKKDYGNIPRAALSYDMTFLAILLIALSNEDASLTQEACILNPFRKKPVSTDHPALVFSAAVSVIFAYYKLLDEIRDDKKFLATAGYALIRRGYRRAVSDFPEADQIIRTGITALTQTENKFPVRDTFKTAAEQFGSITSKLMMKAADSIIGSDTGYKSEITAALGMIGMNTGSWVYIIDAVDDLEKDLVKKSWNPFLCYETYEAYDAAAKILKSYEIKCDEAAAVLPYKRFAGIVSNVFIEGMPKIRGMVFNREKLRKL